MLSCDVHARPTPDTKPQAHDAASQRTVGALAKPARGIPVWERAATVRDDALAAVLARRVALRAEVAGRALRREARGPMLQRVLERTNLPFRGLPGLFFFKDTTSGRYVDPLDLHYWDPDQQGQKLLRTDERYERDDADYDAVDAMHAAFVRARASQSPLAPGDIANHCVPDDESFIESLQAAGPRCAVATGNMHAGSLGAGPCVVLLIRATSTWDRVALGSSHLDSSQMASTGGCDTNVRLLVQSATNLLRGSATDREDEKVRMVELYAVGGQIDEDWDPAEYSRLIVACDAWRSRGVKVVTKVPACGEGECVNAFIAIDGEPRYELVRHGASGASQEDGDDDTFERAQGAPDEGGRERCVVM